MIRVLFVCLGNICRSPMAEAVFAHKVRAAGLGGTIIADSAGTGDWHIGHAPHMGTQHILEVNGVDYTHQARLVTQGDLQAFDYVLTMDNSNLANVRRIGQGRAKVAPFLSYSSDAQTKEVPDPYLTGNFDEVYALVSEAADGLLAAIRRDHNL